MDRVRRNERMAVLTRILAASPNRIYTLSHFCDLFGAAKSTMSEDIDILKDVMSAFELGRLDTVTGAAGGVRYRPVVSRSERARFVASLCDRLCGRDRLLPGGFLYLSDILSTPETVKTMGVIIAGEYYDSAPDFVLTMETKGIPVALMTADALGVPLVIARRSSKVYEGSAVNINYVSGSTGTIETMSLSRRAVKAGQRALIVDDFIKGGGTAKGMVDLMAEFGCEVIGTSFVMATLHPENKKITSQRSLMVMDVDDTAKEPLMIQPSDWILGEN